MLKSRAGPLLTSPRSQVRIDSLSQMVDNGPCCPGFLPSEPGPELDVTF